MEIEVITSLIGNMAFPIAAFIMMYVQNNTTLKELTTAINKLGDLIDRK